ncbi:hypothetical protein AVEN_163518-1 [Araneus ventricosus]|uniref:Uncharacterized protein n=1 Tax=Araneus ventricosus TaxID=182803 RepID=A0A4Y2BSA9_ARAVE|nr:hypothetical protein AVEN_163518-1 [Araneus ventricosus]
MKWLVWHQKLGLLVLRISGSSPDLIEDPPVCRDDEAKSTQGSHILTQMLSKRVKPARYLNKSCSEMCQVKQWDSSDSTATTITNVT